MAHVNLTLHAGHRPGMLTNANSIAARGEESPCNGSDQERWRSIGLRTNIRPTSIVPFELSIVVEISCWCSNGVYDFARRHTSMRPASSANPATTMSVFVFGIGSGGPAGPHSAGRWTKAVW